MRRLRVALLVGLGALALAGCTLVAPNAAPQFIAKSKVPFGLLGPTIPGTNDARVRFVTQPVYIIDATGHLAPSSRIVPSPPALTSVIDQLLLGPLPIEASAGYTSALPKDQVLLSASVQGGIGTIDFATTLDALSRSAQILAIGQLVLTAYDVGATRGIMVKAAGVTQHLLTPSGVRTTLITPQSFEDLLNG